MQSECQTGNYTLAIHVPGNEVQAITLESGKTYALGRHDSSDIVLDHSCVSGRHALLTANAPPTIVDVGSRNGTYVDGRRLPTQTPRTLRNGSVIVMGAVSLFVTQGEWRMSSVRRAVPGGAGPDRLASSVAPDIRPVTRDRAMSNLYALAQQIARTSSSVLITGETGVGKDLMAQAIHRHSPRARRELVVLNCAAIPESLVESELFGYERGAFSGAVSAKPGLFEVAHGSTFFLDEIGELPLSVQAKLLRVLESGEVSRVGAVRQSRVDVRIVAATNRHLPTEIARGAFRADLYYRLNGLTIAIPPLRARPDDIEILARHFAASAGIEFSNAALAVLQAHSWPGNVRELKSVVERAALVTQNRPVEPTDLILDVTPIASSTRDPKRSDENSEATEVTARMRFVSDELPTEVVREELERRELRRIKEALEGVAGNQTEAARLLGISRRTLMNRMDRLGIARPRKGGGRGSDG